MPGNKITIIIKQNKNETDCNLLFLICDSYIKFKELYFSNVHFEGLNSRTFSNRRVLTRLKY